MIQVVFKIACIRITMKKDVYKFNKKKLHPETVEVFIRMQSQFYEVMRLLDQEINFGKILRKELSE